MTIRKLGKPVGSVQSLKKSNASDSISSGTFSTLLETIRGPQTIQQPSSVREVMSATERGAKKAVQEQLRQIVDLLESLEDLEQEMRSDRQKLSRSTLQETRDEALRTLSNTAASQQDKETRSLLRRTVVLATVELAKENRGDYG